MKTYRLLTSLSLLFTVWGLQAATDPWLGDYDAAREQADLTQRRILIYFTGSNWSDACRRLQKQVFSSPEWKRYARERLVLLKVDFPRPSFLSPEQVESNKSLARRYKVGSFPTLVLLDSHGQEIGRQVGYDGLGAQTFLENIKYKFQ